MATRTKIGKDVIESLTMGMYEDSRFIYREYVQNSADQIDLAVECGLLPSHEEGYIDIEIHKSEGIISITDNATGIEQAKAEELLKNIAKSSKDRTRNKGFRGIGRLGGLGYCKSLRFETSFKGEPVKTVLTWDSKQLKEIINDRSKQQDASSVIDEVTSVTIEDCDREEHGFKVILIGVDNTQLLEKSDIIEYLSMVGPVPFDKGFIYTSSIKESALTAGKQLDTYKVFVNTDQVFKAYTSTIYNGDGNNKKRFAQIIDIQTFNIDNIWGWYSISDNLTKQMPYPANPARGVRLRKGNIQIGDDSTLSKFFSEARFNFYFFGEVHVFDKDLIPNARRDYFIENESLAKLESTLKNLLGQELSKLVRYASNIKSTGNAINKFIEKKNELEEKLQKGLFSDKSGEKRVREELEELKDKAEQAEKELEKEADKIELDSSKGKIFSHLTENLSTKVEDVKINDSGVTRFATDSLSKLDRKERKLVSKVFTIIDQVLPKELAENLKEKVKEGFQ